MDIIVAHEVTAAPHALYTVLLFIVNNEFESSCPFLLTNEKVKLFIARQHLGVSLVLAAFLYLVSLAVMLVPRLLVL